MIFVWIWSELSGERRRVRVGASLVGEGAVCVNKTVHVFDASCTSWQRTNIQYYQK